MNDLVIIGKEAARIANETKELSAKIAKYSEIAGQMGSPGVDPFIFAITVFVLACFVGYYVVWKVTPALHTPLMAVTNAISGIIIVGAVIAIGPSEITVSTIFGFIAVIIASINIFGGFVVTYRMLEMFRKK